MKATTRHKRAILRDRRRDNRDAALYGPPLIRAMTGWDLYLMAQWDRVRALVAQRGGTALGLCPHCLHAGDHHVQCPRFVAHGKVG